jgi:hypothetical protein
MGAMACYTPSIRCSSPSAFEMHVPAPCVPANELALETFLIDRFQKPAAHHPINFENGPAYGAELLSSFNLCPFIPHP